MPLLLCIQPVVVAHMKPHSTNEVTRKCDQHGTWSLVVTGQTTFSLSYLCLNCPSNDLPNAEEANFLPPHLLLKLRERTVRREEPLNRQYYATLVKMTPSSLSSRLSFHSSILPSLPVVVGGVGPIVVGRPSPLSAAHYLSNTLREFHYI